MKRDLQARLQEMRRTGEVKTGRELVDRMDQNRKIDLFPGEGREEETKYGPCYMRELKYPLEYRHGNSFLAGALQCCGPDLVLPARDSCLSNFNLSESIFLDIETTGLSGGTGTWAFLIGLGWLENETFILRQYFLRRPAEERAVLSHFAAETERFPAVISFNGKLFDLPLIQTRQTLSGFRHTSPAMHLDLLQCARSLWRKRLPSRSLRSLEESLLGLRRFDDIPGAEIPAVYFDYLRRGETETLKKVFQHNVLDILSMVTLLEKISRLAGGGPVEHPAEALALGQLYLQAGDTEAGAAYLRETAKCDLSSLADEAAFDLANHYKRSGKWEEAAELWSRSASRTPANPLALVELAKYFEHRCRDYEEAIKATKKAITETAGCREIPLSSPLSAASLQHRLRRIERRLNALNKSI